MGTDYLKYYNDLQQELDDAKNTLVALNDNIRRHRFAPFRNEKGKAPNEPKQRTDGERPAKRRSVFNRLSAPVVAEEEKNVVETRPRLTSRVIRELPTRQEIVEAQGTDSESRARNRRMFGSLLGTLHKFCQEETRLKQKEEKKAQIEKKLEEQELQEKETMKRERENLFLDRRRKQIEIRRLEVKMSRVKDFETWESSIKALKHHIRTKTKPHLFYKPKVMSKKTDNLLTETQDTIAELVAQKREALNKELKEIENDLRSNEFDCDEFGGSGVAGGGGGANNQDIEHDKVHSQEFETRETRYVMEKDIEMISKKADADTKENKSRNLNEPFMYSSVVVVKSSTKEPNKVE